MKPLSDLYDPTQEYDSSQDCETLPCGHCRRKEDEPNMTMCGDCGELFCSYEQSLMVDGVKWYIIEDCLGRHRCPDKV